MAKKRTVCTIKQFDYTSKEEFEKDISRMREKGYHLIKKNDYGWSEHFGHDELDDAVWKYTAYFMKDTL